jgi:hypothetical protein
VLDDMEERTFPCLGNPTVTKQLSGLPRDGCPDCAAAGKALGLQPGTDVDAVTAPPPSAGNLKRVWLKSAHSSVVDRVTVALGGSGRVLLPP